MPRVLDLLCFYSKKPRTTPHYNIYIINANILLKFPKNFLKLLKFQKTPLMLENSLNFPPNSLNFQEARLTQLSLKTYRKQGDGAK